MGTCKCGSCIQDIPASGFIYDFYENKFFSLQASLQNINLAISLKNVFPLLPLLFFPSLTH